MECVCPQISPRFILSSERVLGNRVKGAGGGGGGGGRGGCACATSGCLLHQLQSPPAKISEILWKKTVFQVF